VKTKKIILLTVVCAVMAAALLTGIILIVCLKTADWNNAGNIFPEELSLRQGYIQTAEQWLGCNESDGSHCPIIDLYNSHEPLAVGYKVKYTDEWCATFVSAAAIAYGITDIIPTECGCERQIELFMDLDCWVESDAYHPLPGDLIYYCIGNASLFGDCRDRSNHVGIVVGCDNGFLKVIEGNCAEQVKYRYLMVNDPSIRGFATPDYHSKIETAR